MLVELVQTTTRDDLRLDAAFHTAAGKTTIGVDGFCLVHGTGSNFYGSRVLESLAELLAKMGCGVLRANTRGHDWASIAATSTGGGKRQGAAYEIVDDCRHDLAAWVDWLRQHAGPRVGLIGHSLGAVKCLYTVVREPQLDVTRVIAISPPRLSHAAFCQPPSGPEFLRDYHRAEELCHAGEGATLIEVKWPMPLVITAAGYREKYGPDERYNFLRFAAEIPSPALFTFGAQEVAGHVAFQGLPAELEKLRTNQPCLHVATIPDADHYYSGKRTELCSLIEKWLGSIA